MKHPISVSTKPAAGHCSGRRRFGKDRAEDCCSDLQSLMLKTAKRHGEIEQVPDGIKMESKEPLQSKGLVDLVFGWLRGRI